MPADAAARAAATSAALNLLQEAIQATPACGGKSVAASDRRTARCCRCCRSVTGARTPPSTMPNFARTNLPPPPVNGALPAAQPVVPATLVIAYAGRHGAAASAGRHRWRDRAADAVADRFAAGSGRSVRRHVSMLPRRAGILKFRSRRRRARRWRSSRFRATAAAARPSAAKAVWRARFSLNVEPAGPVHALVSLNGDRTSVRMWAERPATAVAIAGRGFATERRP